MSNNNENKLGSFLGSQADNSMKLPGMSFYGNAGAKGGVSFRRMARLYVPKLNASNFSRDVQQLVQQLTNGNGYIDFLLFSVTEPQAEKYQVFDVVGDEYAAYFYGKRPAIYAFSGGLYNTVEDNWRHAFFHLYSEVLRGTQLQKYGRYVTVYYDGTFVSGSMLSLTEELRADSQLMSAFTFELLVKRISYSSERLKFTPNNVDFGDAPFPDQPKNAQAQTTTTEAVVS